MKFKSLIIFVFVTGLFSVSSLRSQDSYKFFSVIDDLPLMDGLFEVVDSGVAFETARGRIIEVSATGVLSQDKLLAFYNKTLPQLGWYRKESGIFKREGEILSLEVIRRPVPLSEATSNLTAVFRIKPSID
tara:strand:+ start:917 stop:1309 length:393 start_codon:yes stop_codon:yes gene_type:complete